MEVVLIVLGIVILALLVAMLVKKGRDRRLEGRREEAGELRETARRHQIRAEREEAEAQERAARAQQAKAEAREHSERAADVDPDADDRESVRENGRQSRSFNTAER